jgi:hypothetical protein
MFRNSILFTAFVVYIDLSKQLIEGGLSPFFEGALCANLAWITVWPLDVVKTQTQSGNYKGAGILKLLSDTFKSGRMFRGLLPGLVRLRFPAGCWLLIMMFFRRRAVPLRMEAAWWRFGRRKNSCAMNSLMMSEEGQALWSL